MLFRIAVLMTCFNRKSKTIACLDSLYKCLIPDGNRLDVYLVDDGASDGTSEAVLEKFPNTLIIQGSGNLFWAGGMRLAWQTALKNNYEAYLLLNDDVVLMPFAISQLLSSRKYSLEHFGMEGIYIGSTCDPDSQLFSYGGHKIIKKISGVSQQVIPSEGKIQSCDFANANILWVSKNVTDKIGILSDRFTHSLADYDYTLTARRLGFPVLVSSMFLGTCTNDHGKNWLPRESSLAERIRFLKSPKHLAYSEYLFYIKRHFPFYFPMSFIKLWGRTFFPVIWDKFKK